MAFVNKFSLRFFFRRKDGEAVKSIKSIKDRVTEKRSDTTATLIVAHSNEDDAGNYSCVAIVKQTEITNATVRAVCKYYFYVKSICYLKKISCQILTLKICKWNI